MMAVLLSCAGNSERKNKDSQSNAAEAIETAHGDMFLLIGTYTSTQGSKGIYVHRFNIDTGESDSVSMAEVANPSYLALSPDEKFVYAVSEGGDEDSFANAFSFDKNTGKLTLLNSQATQGSSPCYIVVDDKGKNVHTANYGGGSISSFQVNEDGSLSAQTNLIRFTGQGTDKERQNAPHLHSVMYSSDGKYLFATDLGLDKLYRYSVNDGSVFEGQPSFSQGDAKAFDVPEVTGPRHFAFHPNGKHMYLLGELSGDVLVYDYNNGDLEWKQTVKSDTVGARGSADIHVSPDGRFLYSSNRLQNDGIAIFSIDDTDGTLTRVGYQTTGKHPRNFVITPNGKFLLVAARDDNKIQVFAIDKESGALSDLRKDILIDKPVCLKFAEWH